MTDLSVENQIASQRKDMMLGIVVNSLPVIGIIATCYIVFLSQPIPVKTPWILFSAALLTLIPIRLLLLETLQMILGFYLVCVLVNQLSAQYFQCPILGIGISYSTMPLALCILAYLVSKGYSGKTEQNPHSKAIIRSWILVLAVLFVHMLFLYPILNRFYGYGYGRDFHVIGNGCLYFLLFITLWSWLDRLRNRQIAGLLLSVFFLIMSI